MLGKTSRTRSKTGHRPAPSVERKSRENVLPKRVRITDDGLAEKLIRERERLGIDRYDEVWDGVYVMPSLPTLSHQGLVHGFGAIFDRVIVQEKRGKCYPGANVSDRRVDWKENYRCPDVVVVLEDSRAIDCNTHLYGGPDFLIEILSPGDDTEEKIPFYEKIQVRELLIVHRDTRQLRLYRHDGEHLVLVEPSSFQGGRWLVSTVLPIALRRKAIRGQPQIEVRRTDGQTGSWTLPSSSN